MSRFTDKISNIFSVDYDDEYDDYEDDYELDEDDYEEEPVVKQSSRVSSRERVVAQNESTITPKRETTRRTRTSSRGGKVVPMKSAGMEVCVIKPVNYEDSTEMIDTILAGKAVIMNLEGINMDLAQRIVDTVSGACYSVKGHLQKISGYIYIVTPASVDITGDFQDILSNSYSAKGRLY